MTWIDRYVAWCTQCTDAPDIFHKWGAYMAMASALGRTVTFEFGPFTIPPNLYVLLLAPSSIYRKSTALSLSKRIAGKVGAYELASDGSTEGLIDDLSTHPQGTIYYGELSSLLNAFEREYSAGLKPLLTDLYDPRTNYRRKLRRLEINLVNPCINIFAASVLAWIVERMKQSDFSGGFLTRFILVSATTKTKSFAIPPPADVAAENQIVGRLREIMTFARGTVSLAPIRSEFTAWVRGFEKRASSPLLAAFIARLQIACLKLTVLEQLAENASTDLTSAALERAIGSIEETVKEVANLEETELSYTTDRDGLDQRRVLRFVRERQHVGRKELLRHTHLSAGRLSLAVNTLAASGLVRVQKHPAVGRGRPTEVIVWQGNGSV